MKTVKMILPLAALFISALAFGQKPTSKGQIKQQERSYQNTDVRREPARTNGVENANQHANARAQQKANENSVLNGTSTTKTKYKSKYRKSDLDKRKYGTRRKAN